jgi:N-formylglutamate amidohydrolase
MPRSARHFFWPQYILKPAEGLLMNHLISLLLAAALASGSSHAHELIEVADGELPVILTAPHGGIQNVPGCMERTAVGSRFVIAPDYNTGQLTRRIAEELKRLTGKSPYLVIAQFHRKYIDANRNPEEAYATADCAAAYRDYHAAVRHQVNEIRVKYPRAILLDIHGQSVFGDSILRGTRYGSTVKVLLARAGAAAITGPDSLFGRFAALGYPIIPANDAAPTDRTEARNYSGGYTVDTYGSHRNDGIDAMQIEFGRHLREPAMLEKTARDSAQAIAAFYESFLR